MDTLNEKIAELLSVAGETHHAVYRKEEGNDLDWATWYSNWLVKHTEFPKLLEKEIVRSKLTKFLVELDVVYKKSDSNMPWQNWYAEKIVSQSETLV